MIADTVALSAGRRPASHLRRRAFLRRLEADHDYAAEDHASRRRRPAPVLVVLCDTNGGTMPEEIAELTKVRKQPSTSQSASTATTIAIWPSPTPWPPSPPAHRRCRAPSTASANAAAMPIWSPSSPTSPSKTRLRSPRARQRSAILPSWPAMFTTWPT